LGKNDTPLTRFPENAGFVMGCSRKSTGATQARSGQRQVSTGLE